MKRNEHGSQRLAVAAVFFATGATFGSWAARVPAIQERSGLSAGELGIAFAGLMVGAFASLPLAGIMIGRFGSRTVLTVSLALFIPLLPLLALSPGLPVLTVILFAFGAANSGVDVAINTHGTDVERRIGKAVMSSFHAMFSVGALAAAGLAAALAAHDVSVVTHFGAVAAVLGALVITAVMRLPDERPHTSQVRGLAVPTRALAVPGAIAFAMVFAEDIVNTWSAVYLRSAAGAGAGTAAGGFMIYSAGMLVGRVLADRVVRVTGARATVQLGGVAATAGAVLTVAVVRPASVGAGLFLIGVGLAPVLPVLFSTVANVDSAAAGPSIAAVTTVGYLGSVVGPPLVGLLAARVGLRAALVAVPVATVATTLLAYRLRAAVKD